VGDLIAIVKFLLIFALFFGLLFSDRREGSRRDMAATHAEEMMRT
jgi:hypothetical protein